MEMLGHCIWLEFDLRLVSFLLFALGCHGFQEAVTCAFKVLTCKL